MGKASGPFQLDDYRMQRALGVLRRPEIAQPCMRSARELLHQGGGQVRFADAGFAKHQHDLALGALRFGPAPHQQVEFFIASDQRGEIIGMHCLKSAGHCARPQRRKGTHRAIDAFESLGAQVAQLE